MKYVGVDLHKQAISLCVVVQKGAQRNVLQRQRLACQNTAVIEQFFRNLGEFQVVVEARLATSGCGGWSLWPVASCWLTRESSE